MNVTEFVTKVMNDKNFMYEVFTHIPDSMMSEENQGNSDQQGELGKSFGKFCWPGAQAMGCTFAENDLVAECERQVNALRGFGKAKFLVRMIKTLGKAKPKKR